MVELARGAGAEVVLIGVPRPGLWNLSSAPFYQPLAKELELPYDGEALAEILGDGDLKADTVHPNAAGYRELAARLEKLLRKHGAVE